MDDPKSPNYLSPRDHARFPSVGRRQKAAEALPVYPAGSEDARFVKRYPTMTRELLARAAKAKK